MQPNVRAVSPLLSPKAWACDQVGFPPCISRSNTDWKESTAQYAGCGAENAKGPSARVLGSRGIRHSKVWEPGASSVPYSSSHCDKRMHLYYL